MGRYRRNLVLRFSSHRLCYDKSHKKLLPTFDHELFRSCSDEKWALNIAFQIFIKLYCEPNWFSGGLVDFCIIKCNFKNPSTLHVSGSVQCQHHCRINASDTILRRVRCQQLNFKYSTWWGSWIEKSRNEWPTGNGQMNLPVVVKVKSACWTRHHRSLAQE